MLCPICSKEMEEGGLILTGLNSGWVPMDQFQKSGLRLKMNSNIKVIGEPNPVGGTRKVPGAFFCKHCNKITGVFDVYG